MFEDAVPVEDTVPVEDAGATEDKGLAEDMDTPSLRAQSLPVQPDGSVEAG
jgi:hypothetical protein